jgi:hypothetical protein
MRLPTTRWILGSILDSVPRPTLSLSCSNVDTARTSLCNSALPVRSHTKRIEYKEAHDRLLFGYHETFLLKWIVAPEKFDLKLVCFERLW